MAPRKKTPSMVWVVKSKQSTTTEKKTDSSLLIDSVSKLQLSSSSVPGWSLLPEELLHIISQKLENDAFSTIHARSVCRPWRSTFPFPSSLLQRTSYSLPAFSNYPRRKSKGFCTLEKFPLFLFRLKSPNPLLSEFYIGGIDRDNSNDRINVPIQCSVKIKESDRTLTNILDCQIISLGYHFRMVGYNPDSLATSYRGAALLPRGGGGEFVVLLAYSNAIFALTSAEMKWFRIEQTSRASCIDLITFRGKFYAVFLNGDVAVIDPYTLVMTALLPSEELVSQNELVPCGDDELFLVQRIVPRNSVLNLSKLACRVSRLDEDAGEWVTVTDLGDRVLLIGQLGNSFCFGEDLLDGCGVSGNSMLFINDFLGVTYSYKYGVDTGCEEDYLNFWRCSKETRVSILCKSPMVALRIEKSSKKT